MLISYANKCGWQQHANFPVGLKCKENSAAARPESSHPLLFPRARDHLCEYCHRYPLLLRHPRLFGPSLLRLEKSRHGIPSSRRNLLASRTIRSFSCRLEAKSHRYHGDALQYKHNRYSSYNSMDGTETIPCLLTCSSHRQWLLSDFLFFFLSDRVYTPARASPQR